MPINLLSIDRYSTIIRGWDLKITEDGVLRGQGADPRVVRSRRPALLKTAEWALKEGLPLLDPVVLIKEIDVKTVRHERLVLADRGHLSGSLIIQHLGNARHVAICLCTIGNQLEVVSAEILQTDPGLGFALEGLGTAAVEDLATQVCGYLENKASNTGLTASIPLSPGMLGWPVNPGQRQIFSILDAAAIGVTLNENDMMIPRMSISQVVGFGNELTIQGRTCDYCDLKDTCRYQDHFPPV